MRSATCILLAAGLGLQCVVSSGFQFQHGRRQMPSTTTQNQPLSPVTGVGNSPESEIPDSVERKRLAMYSRERQAQAMSDARQLAERSRELEAELEQANGDTLPATLFKKADEIIKLAKSVKSKMRPAY
jgi:phosphoglycerate-specific signal transduction histidine kinase